MCFDLWIRLPVFFFYIYIHMIWFYKISYQYASTTHTGMKFDFKTTLTSIFLHTYIGIDFINKIANFRLQQKPTFDLISWMKLPLCFYYIYIHMIWFYKYYDQFFSTNVHRIRCYKKINSFHLLNSPEYDLILWIKLPVYFYYINIHFIFF